MTKDDRETRPVRIHLTNVFGLGAVQLIKSLLPSLETVSGFKVEEIYLPDRGELATYKNINRGTSVSSYLRRLPNPISRLLECTLFGHQFSGSTPLLVLGDIPLRSNGMQTVFVQSTYLTGVASAGGIVDALKYLVSRLIFRMNSDRVAAFIVQTDSMKASLIDTYPAIEGRVHVVAQPVPRWLLESSLKRTRTPVRTDAPLVLFYPAAAYPHKNHKLLSEISAENARLWPVDELRLTIDNDLNPNPRVPWLRCIGILKPESVVKEYATADALVFLSQTESFGFPLIEAMWVGIPIVCPDLPYARALCGDQAIYFSAGNIDSLHQAVLELQKRLQMGWWPDWSNSVQRYCTDWDQVAQAMLRIATGETFEVARM